MANTYLIKSQHIGCPDAAPFLAPTKTLKCMRGCAGATHVTATKRRDVLKREEAEGAERGACDERLNVNGRK